MWLSITDFRKMRFQFRNVRICEITEFPNLIGRQKSGKIGRAFESILFHINVSRCRKYPTVHEHIEIAKVYTYNCITGIQNKKKNK